MTTRISANHRTGRRPAFWGSTVLGLMALTLAACTTGTASQTTSGSTGSTGSTAHAAAHPDVSVVEQAAPSTLDPGRLNNGGGGSQYAELAYDPLIYLAPDGTYQPDLATSWGYVGTGNTTFVLHLRPKVQFSDGTMMTADTVVASIKYAKSGATTASSYLGSLKTVTASGPLTVTLTFSAPQPDLPTIFDQNEMAGDIIGPKLLATPDSLGTQTDGAGPYMISPTDTVTGSSYVYVPNPHYWNHSLRRYDKFTLRVIATTAGALNSLRTGQADFMTGDPTQATAAKSAGLLTYSAPGGFTPLWITDYQGKIVKALGNPLVRQALAFATNRPAIARAIFQDFAQPTSEISSPGYTGYIPGDTWNNYYTYNVDKAKALLRQAGYPNGFTMTVPAFPAQNELQETEALASQFAEIGVTLKIHEVANFNEFVTAFLSNKYAGGVLAYGTLPFSIESAEIFTPTSTFNVAHNPLPAILSLVAAGNVLNGDAANAKYQAAMKLWVQGAYADVMFDNDGVYFARPGTVSNIQIGTQYPGSDLSPDLAFWSPPTA